MQPSFEFFHWSPPQFPWFARPGCHEGAQSPLQSVDILSEFRAQRIVLLGSRISLVGASYGLSQNNSSYSSFLSCFSHFAFLCVSVLSGGEFCFVTIGGMPLVGAAPDQGALGVGRFRPFGARAGGQCVRGRCFSLTDRSRRDAGPGRRVRARARSADACSGSVEPDSGEVLFDGHDSARWRGTEMRRLRRSTCRILFQYRSARLDPRMTVRPILVRPLAITTQLGLPEECAGRAPPEAVAHRSGSMPQPSSATARFQRRPASAHGRCTHAGLAAQPLHRRRRAGFGTDVSVGSRFLNLLQQLPAPFLADLCAHSHSHADRALCGRSRIASCSGQRSVEVGDYRADHDCAAASLHTQPAGSYARD